MTRPRPLLCVLLALCLAAGSLSTAGARGFGPGLHLAVICSGEGVITVAVDGKGNPVGPVHPCPDCMLAAPGLVQDPGSDPGARLSGGAGPAVTPAPLVRTRAELPSRGRDPPASV